MTKKDDLEFKEFLEEKSDKKVSDAYKPENWIPRNLKCYGNAFVNVNTYNKMDWEKIKVEVGAKELEFTFLKATDPNMLDGYVVTVVKNNLQNGLKSK